MNAQEIVQTVPLLHDWVVDELHQLPESVTDICIVGDMHRDRDAEEACKCGWQHWKIVGATYEVCINGEWHEKYVKQSVN